VLSFKGGADSAEEGWGEGGMGIPTSRTRKTHAIMRVLHVLEVGHEGTLSCCVAVRGGWLQRWGGGLRVEEEGSRTRKTHDGACFLCSGGGWLLRWGGGVGKGGSRTRKTCAIMCFLCSGGGAACKNVRIN